MCLGRSVEASSVVVPPLAKIYWAEGLGTRLREEALQNMDLESGASAAKSSFLGSFYALADPQEKGDRLQFREVWAFNPLINRGLARSALIELVGECFKGKAGRFKGGKLY